MKPRVNNHLSLTIASVSRAILIWTSVALVPFFDRVAPNYFKLVNPYGFSPFMSDVFTGVVHTVYHVLLFRRADPYDPALSENMLVRSWTSLLMPLIIEKYCAVGVSV
ncbi:hypothetical protein DPMN_154160 [Dreissena polymorpha]|uniref:Uncharacterized protein n=1 Tax=Dreissena polymorpha TaxID=45954 RepID=A0A9D4JA34_DREPO|nr:hypothetical protein DPMN_154160 [Dreissena polymorpha]